MAFPALILALFALTPLPGIASQTNVFANSLQSRSIALVIGDSLSVGPFGDRLQSFLIDTLGEKNVSIYAICGSSPEHWLDKEPKFTSRCGFRVKVPDRSTDLGRHEHGHPPEPRAAGKIGLLLKKTRPSVVIVQLGTNWFDMLAETPPETARARMDSILEQFVETVRRSSTRPQLIWITPPDSSKFRHVQAAATEAILRAARRHSFQVVSSFGMIYYAPGKSGGDGVHLAPPAAFTWFEKVKTKLRPLLKIAPPVPALSAAPNPRTDR